MKKRGTEQKGKNRKNKKKNGENAQKPNYDSPLNHEEVSMCTLRAYSIK